MSLDPPWSALSSQYSQPRALASPDIRSVRDPGRSLSRDNWRSRGNYIDGIFPPTVRRGASGRRYVDRIAFVCKTYFSPHNTYRTIRFRTNHHCSQPISRAEFMRPHFAGRSCAFCVKQHEESGATHCQTRVYGDTTFFRNVSRPCGSTSPRVAGHMNLPSKEESSRGPRDRMPISGLRQITR